MDRPTSKLPSQVPFQTPLIPPIVSEVPLAEAPEPVIRQQETIELWVPKPDVYHEGIPECVEYKRLSKLKKLVNKYAVKEGPAVAKGSTAALSREYSDDDGCDCSDLCVWIVTSIFHIIKHG